MMKSILFFAAAGLLAQPTPTEAFVNLGGLTDAIGDSMESLTDMMNELNLGEQDADLAKLMDDLFSGAGSWLTKAGGFLADIDFSEITSMIDTAVSGASDDIKKFATTFEKTFADGSIPDQYALFFKDATMDLGDMAKDLFSEENVKGFTDDALQMFSGVADGATDMFALLNVDKVVEEMKKAGVDVGILKATAAVEKLFEETMAGTNDIKGMIPAGVDVGAIQKAIATMTPEAQIKFVADMTAATNAEAGTVDVAQAWKAMAEEETIIKELNAQSIPVSKVSASAVKQVEEAEKSGGASTAAVVAVAVAAVAAMFV